ncbi:BAG family molecular chaperone regulator 2-like [Tripterygium wilfordii]|uniref:BAG family molecular chaperone regulator 2-like n=1 Tax=Tripterygium wilfordii TaxID=458696 RepID=A0A7J7CQM6_TRIWF|nr:BAG family molecular chaperone regulator 3-like [Tripterygium wilfordii]KAF5736361.1 BAG family molecular chaperone regulator 2-like [Tripterygium wilfordii]
MMKKRSNARGRMSEAATNTTSSASIEEDVEWEMRPGGMLVQKRSDNKTEIPGPKFRIRVAYGALRYEIFVNSQATFGEVKKLLTAETGLQAGDQRIVYRGKERENGEYLDMCGVKDRTKLTLIEDPASIERRCIEMRRNSKIQSAHRAISDLTIDIDKLIEQVSAIEKSISNGVKVPEVQITTLIEMLMRQAIKLDSISAEGEASSLKTLQGKRVQKCVETLDVLKISNARVKAVVVTTKWETFDPSPTTVPQWEFFD